VKRGGRRNGITIARAIVWSGVLFSTVASGRGHVTHSESREWTLLQRPFTAIVSGTQEERRLLSEAYEFAIRDCMRSRQFTYVPNQMSFDNGATDPQEDNGYGFVTRRAAEREGYGFARETVSHDGDDANLRYLQTLGEDERKDWNEAMSGSISRLQQIAAVGTLIISADPTACTSIARDRVYHACWAKLTYWVQNLANDVVRRTAADRRFTPALRRWRQCMIGVGYPVEAGIGAGAKYARSSAHSGDPDAERKIATADAECLERTGMWEVARNIQQSYEETVRRANHTRFSEIQRLRRAALGRVRDHEAGKPKSEHEMVH
jgi:hypothetical protein